jgi:hypothetical protein
MPLSAQLLRKLSIQFQLESGTGNIVKVVMLPGVRVRRAE